MELLFDFYGLHVSIQSQSSLFHPVLEKLAADLSYFVSEKPAFDPIRITLSKRAPEVAESFKGFALPFFRTKLCRAFGWSQRFCDFGEGHGVLLSTPFEHLVFGSDADRVYEMASLLVLSRVGEELESQNGWLRIHALGFSRSGEASLILLPNKEMQSQFAKRVLKSNTAKFFGDEIVFTDGQLLFPFPVRWAQATAEGSDNSATIIPIQVPLSKLAQNSAPLMKIFMGARGSKTFIKKLNLWDQSRFIAIHVLGLGLQQKREFLIRGDNWTKLPVWVLRRFQLSTSLLKTIPAWKLSTAQSEIGRDQLNEILNLSPDIDLELEPPPTGLGLSV